jgi:hypothetical protein
MDNYLIGEVLFEGVTVYTSWLPPQGNSAIFAVDVMGISGLTLTVTLQTKAHDATDESANISEPGSISSVTATGVARSSEIANFKGLFRYKISTGGTASMDWVWLRLLDPAWRLN